MGAPSVVSLFSGAGGLDLGFRKVGFDIAWANEYDKTIWATYRKNHPNHLDTRSITEIPSADIPDCAGLIGGPPCQSWSIAGKMRGIDDKRGQLFFEYLRVLRDKKPAFFVAENVPGMKSATHIEKYASIRNMLEECGYNIFDGIITAADHGVPQDRKRVLIVGYRTDIGKTFSMPSPRRPILTLHDAISDLPESIPALAKNAANEAKELKFPNHEHMTGKYSSNYMSRNRIRTWDEPSFTIIASGRHAPQHPAAPPMTCKSKDVFEFCPDAEYRRLSIRECARIQTFPDNFEFVYERLADAYKMIGNAVPVELSRTIAATIMHDIFGGESGILQNTSARSGANP